MERLTPEMLIQGYGMGIFPMAESRDDAELHWIDPKRRGILPLDQFHIPRSLKKALRRDDYTIRVNSDFPHVIAQCASRDTTWINDAIMALFIDLHHRGLAHSVECWQDDTMTGGLYGLALGRAFFGESMFSIATNTSKIALVALVARLKYAGFTLLDTQFVTDHLNQFGTTEIPRRTYLDRLHAATSQPAVFPLGDVPWEMALG